MRDRGLRQDAVTEIEDMRPVAECDQHVIDGAIKRVDNYDIHVKYETDLETWIKLHVKADRLLSKEEKADLDFDNEGNLIEKRPPRDRKEDKGDKPEKKKKKEAAPKKEKAPARKAAKADKGEEKPKRRRKAAG